MNRNCAFEEKKKVCCAYFVTDQAESEKTRRRVGIADRKVFARLESFCAYLQNWLKINSKHSISLEGFQTVWKYIGQFAMFPDSLKSF